MDNTGIGKTKKTQLIDYFKYQSIATMGDTSENKLIVGNDFQSSVLK